MTDQMTVGQAMRALAADLAGAGVDDPLREARLIVAHFLSIPVARMTLAEHDVIAGDDLHKLREMAAPRLDRRPLSHLLGRRAFFKHVFTITPDVLDPRAETETLVLAALDTSFKTVLDLGTGSGAILLSLLAERPGARGTGTDLSAAALEIAQLNAIQLGLEAQATFIQSDWFLGLSERFDLIVSNPPYIAAQEMAGLAPELSFEPRMALTDEADGLTAYRAICAGAPQHLTAGGCLMVEIGWQQAADVQAIMACAGLHDIGVIADLDGRDRVVIGFKRTV